MSSQARPISPTQFATALADLPAETLYAKVAEIRNSIDHLARSNRELDEYSRSVGGDADCVAALRENEEVMRRMKERIGLIRREIERRGQKWHEGEVNGETDGGEVAADGRLSDEELRRQMEETTAGDGDGGDGDDEGVHL